MRIGADQRTQVCRGMNCKVIRKEADMVPAWALLGKKGRGKKYRGWYCLRCAQAVKDSKKKVADAQKVAGGVTTLRPTVTTPPEQARQLIFPPEATKKVGGIQ